MKKYLIILLVALPIISVAQKHFGIEVNYAYLRYKLPEKRTIYYSQEWDYGCNLLISYNFNAKNKIKTGYGFSIKEFTYHFYEPLNTIKEGFKFTYTSIPVLYGFQILKRNKVGIEGEFGLSFNILRKKERLELTTDSVEVKGFDGIDFHHNNPIFLKLAMRIYYRINENLEVGFKPIVFSKIRDEFESNPHFYSQPEERIIFAASVNLAYHFKKRD